MSLISCASPPVQADKMNAVSAVAAESLAGSSGRAPSTPGPLHRNDALDAKWLKRQKRLSIKAGNRGVVVTEAGSYQRLIDSCITQVKAQGPSRTCTVRE